MSDVGRDTPRVVASSEGTHVYIAGRSLLGGHPRASQERRLPRSPAEQTLYLLVSPLLCEGCRTFLQNLPRSSAAVAMEYDDALASLWEDATLPTSPQIDYVRSPDVAGATIGRFVAERAIRRVEVVSLSAGNRRRRQQYDETTVTANEVVQRYWLNRGTEIRLGRRWIANVWRNILMDSGDVRRLRESVPSRAVLIGAGPSLDLALPHLMPLLGRKEHRPMVVALDTALPALAAYDIPVDIVVAMDAQVANTADLVPRRFTEAVLVADITTHPSIVRSFAPDRRLFFASAAAPLAMYATPHGDPVGTILHGIPLLPPRGSVAPSALEYLVEHLGIRDVVLVGVDFWYQPPRTHADHATAHRAFLRTHRRLSGSGGSARILARPFRPERTVDGTVVPADAILADQAEQFRRLIAEENNAGPRGTPRVVRFVPAGLPLATAEVSRAELSEFLIPTSAWRVPNSLRSEAHDEENTQRRSAVTALLRRLNEQERSLADTDRALHLDAGLDFAWFDLPQYPLCTRRVDWAELHRGRLLRAVRDHRRRLERALAATTPPAFP